MSRDGLAARMFLLLHDPFTGRPALGRELLGCGLVAAALADLILDRRVGVEGEHVVVADARDLGHDELAAVVVQGLRSAPDADSVVAAVELLGDPVHDVVARRLVADGTVRREAGPRRLLGRGPDRFPAVDLLAAARPRLRLEAMLRDPRTLDVPGAALAAIVGAMEAERLLDGDRPRAEVHAAVTAAAERLPIDLRSLVAGVRAAAGGLSVIARL